jgi:hypothetical protein
LLACGIVAPVLHIVMDDVIAASLYPGYDRIAQPVSALSATYAPSRLALIPLGGLFELLMIAFWIGVWRAAPANRALRLTSGLMLGFAALGLLASAFPMRTHEVLGANTIHTIIWGGIAPLLMLAGIGVSAAAFGNAFRVYAILTLVALVACSVLTGMLAAQANAGETVRWFGIAERALMGAWLQWVAVLAITLLRAQGARPTGPESLPRAAQSGGSFTATGTRRPSAAGSTGYRAGGLLSACLRGSWLSSKSVGVHPAAPVRPPW